MLTTAAKIWAFIGVAIITCMIATVIALVPLLGLALAVIAGIILWVFAAGHLQDKNDPWY